MINSANVQNQFGDLVVEPICVNKVTQEDAILACQNFHQNISIPPIGSHVKITGSYVLDILKIKLNDGQHLRICKQASSAKVLA